MTTATTTSERKQFAPFTIHRTLTNVLTRWACEICSGHTEKDMILYEFADEDGEEGIVCDQCVEAGAEAIPARLEAKAERLRKMADALQFLASRNWSIDDYEIAEDPDLIADMINVTGQLGRCGECGYVAAIYVEEEDFLGDDPTRFVQCPSHGKTVLAAGPHPAWGRGQRAEA